MKLKAMFALAMAALLQGCFLTPGVFDSTLDLRRDGSFSFAYKGEIVFAIPEEVMKRGSLGQWSDDQAYCTTAPKSVRKPRSDVPIVSMSGETRPCTATEIAEQKKSWEEARVESAKSQAEEQKKFAQLFGYTPGDDEANRRLAAQIAKFDGFKTVTYRGNGVFDVDYAKAGRLDHDFVFPVLVQGNALFPFVLARRQNDGAVRVAAPAFTGGSVLGALGQMSGMGNASASDKLPPSRAKGRFTLTTDGEVLTNNTENGPEAATAGKRLVWDVDQRTTAAPEALIRLR